MIRNWFFAFALASALGASCASAFGGEILSEEEAARHGLTRAWFSQVQVDPTRGGIVDIVVDDGMLFVQTDQAILQAINAETGQTAWTQQVGDPHHPSLTPGVSGRMVAALNGSNLFILNRHNGKLLWKIPLDGAPGAGPALSQQRVYVPMASGMLVSYRLKPVKDTEQELGKQKKKTAAPEEGAAQEADHLDSLRLEQSHVSPLTCQSLGRTLVQPLITRQNADEEFVAWPTDKGYLYIARVNRQEHGQIALKYRLQTDAPIVAQPAYMPPKGEGSSGAIFCVSQDGFIHAIREKDGQQIWRFSTGEPIVEAPVVVGQRVFVANQLGGMYSLDAKSGTLAWPEPARGVTRFLAASKDRLYTTDRQGNLLVLDAASGSRLDTVAVAGMLPVRPANIENDRVFLATKGGLVQALHERELSSPVVHHQRPAEVEEPSKPSSKEVAANDKSEEKEGEVKPAPRSSGGATTTSSKKSGSKSGSGKKKSSAKAGFGSGVPEDMEGGKKAKGKKARGGEEMGGMPMPGPMPAGGKGGKKGKTPKFGQP